ncbi:hypothetical protein [Massilia sp. YMA4]|uniref:hypothetical protein n=1 Tax=Massilia sp. YMA4 TaxID=1593482 RepID=UPI001D0CA0C4|nr:hypothetical protein [Massilia sp. YMA4]
MPKASGTKASQNTNSQGSCTRNQRRGWATSASCRRVWRRCASSSTVATSNDEPSHSTGFHNSWPPSRR